MVEKPLIWLGDSREAISGFPDAARQIAGFQLWRVQRELYVLHAFEKRTRRTPQDVLDLARHRLRLLLNQRARQKG